MDIRIRKNQNALTAAEWTKFTNAVKAIKQPSATAPTYNTLVGYHNHSWHRGVAHRLPEFLPWHRQYLLDFETRLRAVDSSVTLPYWDWTTDFDVPTQLANPADWGVTRNPLASIRSTLQNGNLAGRVRIAMDSTTFQDFHNNINRPHGSVHNNVGGQMRDINNSLADVLFWLHHCFIDKVWADWQLQNPNAFPNANYNNALTAFTGKDCQDVLDSANLGVFYYDYFDSILGTYECHKYDVGGKND